MCRLAGLVLSTALALLFLTVSAFAAGREIPLRVLTYNIWGLPVPVEHAPWRYTEIAKRLNDYDVIAFQETWANKTDVIWKNLKTHPYHAFGGNPHGLIGGSGLIVVSKYPIIESHFSAFHDCSNGECPAKKGVLMFRVRVASGVEVDFYTAHLNAWEDESMVRSSQIMELVGSVMDHTIGNPIIVLGDFNSDFHSINYDEIVGNLTLNDSYDDYFSRLPNATLDQRHGYTFDVFKNPWAALTYSGETHPQKLDYIFYRSGDHRLRVLNSSLAFTEPVSGDKPLSDHYGVTTLFSIQTE